MATIRRAREDEARTLSAIARTTFIETFGALYRQADLSDFLEKNHSVAAYEKLLADPKAALWLVEKDSAPVGYCVAGPCTLPAPDKPPNAGELARLYLLQSTQGGGLGTRLLETALAWLTARFERVYLSVYAENFGAQRLYTRAGFIKVHEYFYMVGEQADPEWIMELRR